MLSWFVYNFPFLSEIEHSLRTPCRPNFKPTRRQSGIKSNRQVKWAARIPPNKLPASCHLGSKILTSLFYLPLFLNHLGRKVFNSLLKSCFLLRRNTAAEAARIGEAQRVENPFLHTGALLCSITLLYFVKRTK